MLQLLSEFTKSNAAEGESDGPDPLRASVHMESSREDEVAAAGSKQQLWRERAVAHTRKTHDASTHQLAVGVVAGGVQLAWLDDGKCVRVHLL